MTEITLMRSLNAVWVAVMAAVGLGELHVSDK
jgi:hypothetical protein